jgi:succinoglycan biosynthesis protein ExoO
MIDKPLISVIMCNYNCAAYLPEALKTGLEQGDVAVEIIVVDDQSTDESRAVVERIAAADPRVRLLVTPRNMGPAGARNLGIEAARGDWIAIQDSDDLVHPERLIRLLKAAEADQADIVADDLLIFQDDRRGAATRLMSGDPMKGPRRIALADYIDSNRLYSKGPSLGYLKPVFRASLFADGRFRYTETLRIAEDYDLILRMLASGRSLLLTPDLTYFYRKRSTSISHRLSPKTVADMLDADRAFRADFPQLPAPAVAALDRRVASIETALAFEDVVAALKARKPSAFVSAVARNPWAAWLLTLPVKARLGRLFGAFGRKPAAEVPQDGRNLAFVSRQRIVGPTNGSSIYALSIVKALSDAGYRCHYIVPSASVFGSIPVLKLGPAMAVFDTITVHGGMRFRDWLVCLDWKIWLRALARIADVGLLRLKLTRKPMIGPAPYSIAVPLTREDALFLATHAPAKADAVLFDYAFLTEARPYLLRPEAPSMVLMHDLFSSRQSQFQAIGFSDSVAALDLQTEVKLLGQADRVIAIQSQEGQVIADVLGKERVLVAPMAVSTVETPHPGHSGHVLFVGSGTAPNVDAITWFLAGVWPGVRARIPGAVLDVVGNVGNAVPNPPEGVKVHGLVDDLGAFYRAADVVISPLRAGSGLKIKLVEALSFGKAIVASTVTCQGVEDLVRGSVVIEDEASRQRDAIVELLANEPMRADLARKALVTASEQFGVKACYGPIVEFAETARTRRAVPV